jgi:hypothetical protein
MGILRDIGAWLRDVARAWVGWVGGSTIMVVLGVGQTIGIWPALPKQAYYALLAFGLLVSVFQAWRAERRSKVEIEKKYREGRPRLMFSVNPPTVNGEWNRLFDSKQYSTNFFEIKHLGGRPATFVEVFPIPSESGKFCLTFERLPFVDGSNAHILRHSISPGDKMGVDGFGRSADMLVLFLRDGDKPSSHYPIIIHYNDGDERLTERATLLCLRPELKLVIAPPD